jgi:hypothetical protein
MLTNIYSTLLKIENSNHYKITKLWKQFNFYSEFCVLLAGFLQK